MGFIVAIDGPAGAGKGTITKLVGEKKNLIYIDTGALYRCVTLYMIKNKISLDEIEKIKDVLNKINIELKKEIEKLTAMNVVDLEVVARNIYIPQEE